MDGNDLLESMTGFQFDLLCAIATMDEPHGLGVKDKLESWYDTDDVHHGRLYPNLDELVKRNYVRKGTKNRRTNVYSLTKRGEGALQARKNHLDAVLEEVREAGDGSR